jgi:hypothetical protein
MSKVNDNIHELESMLTSIDSAEDTSEFIPVEPIHYERKKITWAEFKKYKLHPIFEILGFTYQSEGQKIFKAESGYFQFWDAPVVTSNKIVLTHPEVYYKVCNTPFTREMEIIEAKNLDPDDIVRFINFGLIFRKLDRKARGSLVKEIQQYLLTPKGNLWQEEEMFKGLDINEKIGFITGSDSEVIKKLRAINKAPYLYDNKDYTLEQQYTAAVKLDHFKVELDQGNVEVILGENAIPFNKALTPKNEKGVLTFNLISLDDKITVEMKITTKK